MWANDEIERAAEEDRILNAALKEAETHAAHPMSTPESIAAGEAATLEAREKAAEILARRIESKELLSVDELREALGITRLEIEDAVVAARIFSLEGPGGVKYYPAFYANGDLDRSALEIVAQELRELPAGAKYHFFFSKRTSLGMTPLEALKCGRVDEVLQAATAFANA